MSLPDVVSRDEWLAARKELLAKEKELTRRRDALNAERRRLPMVEIEKDYVFEGPDGEATLLDLFEGRRQLIVVPLHVRPRAGRTAARAAPRAPTRCRDGLLEHLHARDTTLAYVSRAPLGQDRALQGQARLDVPLVLVVRQRLQLRLPRHARRGGRARRVQLPHGRGAPSRRARAYYVDGDSRSSCPARAASCATATASSTPTRVTPAARETTGGSYYFLDLTALGRQEEWEEPKGRADRPARRDAGLRGVTLRPL